MIYRIEFNQLSALLVDFVDHRDGFLYLRMVGPEATVNAIWAKLSAKEGRGKKWGSPVCIPIPGQHAPQYVAAQKRVTYRTLRARLPSGMVDLALVHPLLTVGEDSQQGFYLLSYEAGRPAGFFERLNKSLSVPLKPDWTDWLWQAGQQSQSFLKLITREVREKGQMVERAEVVELTETPIDRVASLGRVQCYLVHCGGHHRDAWLHIIRDQLGLGIRLRPEPHLGGGHHYLNGSWGAYQIDAGWELHHHDEIVAHAPSLNYLFAEARETLGLHFLIERSER